MMKNKLLLIALALGASSVSADTIVHPDKSTPVQLSAENPNRIICQGGDINDMAVPGDLPIDPKAKGSNVFLSYKKLQKPDASFELITKVHTLHVVCAGEVYTMEVTPVTGMGKQIRLGDPLADAMRANLKIARERSEDEIIATLIKAAYHNDLPPNYTVVRKSQIVDADLTGLTVQLVRTISLNGIGLALKEYKVTGAPGTLTPPRMFLKNGIKFSTRLRGVSVKPERLDEKGVTRLFILEDKV